MSTRDLLTPTGYGRWVSEGSQSQSRLWGPSRQSRSCHPPHYPTTGSRGGGGHTGRERRLLTATRVPSDFFLQVSVFVLKGHVFPPRSNGKTSHLESVGVRHPGTRGVSHFYFSVPPVGMRRGPHVREVTGQPSSPPDTGSHGNVVVRQVRSEPFSSLWSQGRDPSV